MLQISTIKYRLQLVHDPLKDSLHRGITVRHVHEPMNKLLTLSINFLIDEEIAIKIKSSV